MLTQLGHIAHKNGRHISDIVSRLVPSDEMSRLGERTFSELVYNCQYYRAELLLNCKRGVCAVVVSTDSFIATITFVTNYSAIRQAIAIGSAFQYKMTLHKLLYNCNKTFCDTKSFCQKNK